MFKHLCNTWIAGREKLLRDRPRLIEFRRDLSGANQIDFIEISSLNWAFRESETVGRYLMETAAVLANC